jgi:hypothetical protein
MDELKPCPFCGSEAEMHTRYDSFDSIANYKSEIPKTAKLICEKKYPERKKYYVYRKKLYVPRCTISSCMGRNTRGFELKSEAEDLWNRRATE